MKELPKKQYNIVYADPPRIELFSRENVEGWDAWGNQIPTTMQKVL